MTLTREEKITRWINKKPIGARFSASEMNKQIKLGSSKTAGKLLSMSKQVKDSGMSGNGNTIIWEKVRA